MALQQFLELLNAHAGVAHNRSHRVGVHRIVTRRHGMNRAFGQEDVLALAVNTEARLFERLHGAKVIDARQLGHVIGFSKHALGYTAKRGFTIGEVEAAIRTCPWGAAELGRLDCRKNFPHGGNWNGKFYATKQVRPIFVDGPQEIVVITVYTYYF
jgi:hypothetical protein